MVLGEEQILGQIKNSITSAREIKASGQHLNTLFDKAIRIGTRIRNSSGIGAGGISVGSMAVKLAEENIDELKTKKSLTYWYRRSINSSCKIITKKRICI